MKYNYHYSGPGYLGDPKICGTCGGKCCKRIPGAAIPDDFDNDEEKVILALVSGIWCLDWWSGKEDSYFPRIAVKGYEGQLFHGTWGGQCSLLRKNGCALSFEKRPVQCRSVRPIIGGNCPTDGPNKRQTALAWHSWQPMFRALWHHYDGPTGDHLFIPTERNIQSVNPLSETIFGKILTDVFGYSY